MKKIIFIFCLMFLLSCESITHENELGMLKEKNIELKNNITELNESIEELKKESNIKKSKECLDLYNKLKTNYSKEEDEGAIYKEIETKNVFYSEIKETCIVGYHIEEKALNVDFDIDGFEKLYFGDNIMQTKNTYYIDDLNYQINLYNFSYNLSDTIIIKEEYHKKIEELK